MDISSYYSPFNTRYTMEIRHGNRTYTTKHSRSDLAVYEP